jgi:hypothetical protein
MEELKVEENELIVCRNSSVIKKWIKMVKMLNTYSGIKLN